MKQDSNRIKKAMDETVLRDIDVTEEEKRKLLANLHGPQKAKRSYKKYYIGLSAAVFLLFLAALPFMIDFNGGQFMTNSSEESNTGAGDSSSSEMADKRTEESIQQGESGEEAVREESEASWAYRFVKWNGETYVITETEIAAERIGNEIGEVTAFSHQEGAEESGNFSNVFEKGTTYYEITDIDPNEAIAVKREETYIKAVVREQWLEEERN